MRRWIRGDEDGLYAACAVYKRASDLINGDENVRNILDLIIGVARELPSSG